MGVKVKCKFCGESIDKELAFKEEYLTDSLSIRYRYFCSEECFNKKNEEIVRKQWLKEIKKENREKIRTICGLGEKEKNIYFQSTYKSITDNFSQEDIYKFINKFEKDMLDILNNIDFKTVNSRIKYCLVMLENQLQHYILEKEQPKPVEEKKEIEVDDFDINVNVKKKERRDINDILGL